MSSFSCPHFDMAADRCLLLQTDCVPGRRGCVLHGKVIFVVPAEQRVEERRREKAKRQQEPAK